MRTVYVETTIPSYYFETRRDARARAWQHATRVWWDQHRHRYELVTSRFVLDELGLSPEPKRTAAMELLGVARVLPVSPALDPIIHAYIQAKLMPRGSAGDAAHLAAASYHSVDFILTWNCRHLANANKFRHIAAINKRLGLDTPILTTPINLFPENT
jgi:hypothetical protein